MGRLGILEIVILLVVLLFFVVIIASYWRLYEKAEKPGWASIIPIYNNIILLEIIKKPWWWIFLMMIPFFGLIWWVWSLNLFVKSFGKNEGYTLGCILLPYIFLPLLAFDKTTKYLQDFDYEIEGIGK